MANSLFSTPLMPKLHYASEIEFPRGKKFHILPHHHEGLTEFLLIREGEGHFHLEGQRVEAKSHSLLLYQQGIWHEEHSNPEFQFKAFSIGGNDFQLEGLPPNFLLQRHVPPMIPLGDHYFRLEQRVQEMIREVKGYTLESQGMANHLFALFLLDLVRIIYYRQSTHKVNPSAVRSVAEAKRYIQEHYSENITLDKLCHISYTSANYLCRIFTMEEGLSPIQYLIRYRIEAAKHYLRSTDEPIKNVAALVGYGSETHFMNVFKKISGTTPGRYRGSKISNLDV